MKRMAIAALAMTLGLGMAPVAQAATHKAAQTKVDAAAIEAYMRGYFQEWIDVRMENPAAVASIEDYYAETVNIYKNPKMNIASVDFSKPYAFDPANCREDIALCKKDIHEHLVDKFVTSCPGLVHDPKSFNIRPLGKGIWEAWVFYDFRANCTWGNGSFPTVSIYTIDMNQTRANGGKGRNLRVINILKGG